MQQVERYLFVLRAIEANLAEHDTIVSQLTEKIDRVRGFNRALSEETHARGDFIQSSIVDYFVL